MEKNSNFHSKQIFDKTDFVFFFCNSKMNNRKYLKLLSNIYIDTYYAYSILKIFYLYSTLYPFFISIILWIKHFDQKV
jgi:hypothetical protein